MDRYSKRQVALVAELLADKLTRTYRDEQIPAMVDGFASAGFTFDPAEIMTVVSRDVSGQDFVAKREAKEVRQVQIHTQVSWEKWSDFYSDALDPLMSAGAEIDIRLELAARADRELESDPTDRLRDSLRKLMRMPSWM